MNIKWQIYRRNSRQIIVKLFYSYSFFAYVHISWFGWWTSSYVTCSVNLNTPNLSAVDVFNEGTERCDGGKCEGKWLFNKARSLRGYNKDNNYDIVLKFMNTKMILMVQLLIFRSMFSLLWCWHVDLTRN